MGRTGSGLRIICSWIRTVWTRIIISIIRTRIRASPTWSWLDRSINRVRYKRSGDWSIRRRIDNSWVRSLRARSITSWIRNLNLKWVRWMGVIIVGRIERIARRDTRNSDWRIRGLV